jgi:hypothetical protein
LTHKKMVIRWETLCRVVYAYIHTYVHNVDGIRDFVPGFSLNIALSDSVFSVVKRNVLKVCVCVCVCVCACACVMSML